MHQRDREDHVSTFSDQGGASLQADHEANRLKPFEHGLRIDEVVWIHARDDEGLEFTVSSGDQDLVGLAAFQRRQGFDSPRRLGVDTGSGVRHRSAAG